MDYKVKISDGKNVSNIVVLTPKTFKSGRKGWSSQKGQKRWAKVKIGNKKFVVSISLMKEIEFEEKKQNKKKENKKDSWGF